jgi:transcriptional regulator with XRE-family HTH domain
MDISEMVAFYKAGDSLEKIANKAGVSRGTVARRIRGQTKIRKRGESVTPRELGPEWADLGKIPDTILAERNKCTRQNVAKLRKARGIPSFMEMVHAKARANNPD